MSTEERDLVLDFPGRFLTVLTEHWLRGHLIAAYKYSRGEHQGEKRAI